MKKRHKSDKILKIKLLPTLFAIVTLWLIVTMFVFKYNPNLDLLSIIFFSLPGCISLVLGLIYSGAAMLGCGLDSIKDPNMSVMNGIGLVKSEYAKPLHRILLLIFILFLLFLSSVLLLIPLFTT